MPLSTHFIGLTQERVGVCSVCSFCIYSVGATVIWLPEYVKCLKFTSGNISRNVNLQIFQGTALHKAVSCKVRLYLQRLTMTVSSSAPSSASGYFELAVMNSSSVAHARIVGSKSSTVSCISDIAAVAFIALSQLLRLELAIPKVTFKAAAIRSRLSVICSVELTHLICCFGKSFSHCSFIPAKKDSFVPQNVISTTSPTNKRQPPPIGRSFFGKPRPQYRQTIASVRIDSAQNGHAL